jgi:hypothetical protein
MRLYFISLIALLFMFSCNTKETDSSVKLDNQEIQKSLHRGIQDVKDINAQQVIYLGKAQADNDADAVTNIQRSLMGAEKEKQTLAVDFTCSDEPAKTYFSFNIKSQDQKDLTFDVFDEEGYEVGQNTLQIHSGNNYKGLNVKSLENGDYIIRFKDEFGAELTRQFTVEN